MDSADRDASPDPAEVSRASAEAELSQLAAGLLRRPPTLGRSRLVAVDGPAGSGKTTLAAQLCDRLGGDGITAAVLHLDDLYRGWAGLEFMDDLRTRLIDQVLRPLAANLPGRWQRYDWSAGRFAEWHDLPPADVLIVEGCASGARAFSCYLTLLVWVEAEPETRISRGVARDGERLRARWLAWMESEARHFADDQTRQRSDVRLSTG
jgi:uridine kinase